MRKHLLIIALIALIACITMPVQAYTLQYSGSAEAGGSYTQAPLEANSDLTFNNKSLSGSITRIEYDITKGCIIHTGNATGSYTAKISSASGALTPIGNYTATWSMPYNATTCDANSAGPGNLDIDILDITGSSGAGTRTVYLWGLKTYINGGGSSHFTVQRGTSAYSPLPNTDYWFTSVLSWVDSIGGTLKVYTGTSVTIPEASFTCEPTSQFPNEDVVCTDSSTNTPTSWLWKRGINGQAESGWETATTQNFTWSDGYPALYTVKLWAENEAGGSWYNRTDYVSISNNATPTTCDSPIPSGYIRSMFQCVDSQTNGAIDGCSISLFDQEGNAWSNNSAAYGGTHCIDTLPLHHISGYGSATGYTSTYRTDLIASSTVMYELIMIPGYVPNATAGKVWLYVFVNDRDTKAAIQGATVSISGAGQSTQSGSSDISGIYQTQWANVSTAFVTVNKAGYGTGTKTLTTSSFGPDTIRVEIAKGTVTPTATQTTGPGGTTIPTVGPYGTPGPGGTYAPGYTNNQGQIMMDFLAKNGLSLVELCFFVTVCALLGFKFGK